MYFLNLLRGGRKFTFILYFLKKKSFFGKKKYFYQLVYY